MSRCWNTVLNSGLLCKLFSKFVQNVSTLENKGQTCLIVVLLYGLF